jgi:hypothetical protein
MLTSSRAIVALLLLLLAPVLHGALPKAVGIAPEPGTISLEAVLPQPVRLVVRADAIIYYHATFDSALGNMAAGTVVTLAGMSDTGYRVRGRARHGDVAGWMRLADLQSKDPLLHEKLKAFYERQKQITALIETHQVALGMTLEEVQQALGKPTRRSSRITAAGREDRVEYAVFEKVPQVLTSRDSFGQLVQSTVYVKVEVGTLSISFKAGVVEAIEEVKGNPLGGGGVKIVPIPILLR